MKVRIIVREDSPQLGTTYRTFDLWVPPDLQVYLEGTGEADPLPPEGVRLVVGAEQVE